MAIYSLLPDAMDRLTDAQIYGYAQNLSTVRTKNAYYFGQQAAAHLAPLLLGRAR